MINIHFDALKYNIFTEFLTRKDRFVQEKFEEVEQLSETIKSETISRRTAFSLLGLAAAATVVTVLNAEAQTPGMERRDERRGKTPEETTETDKTPAEESNPAAQPVAYDH